jgi:hypothetical protein
MPAAMERIFANFKEDRPSNATPGSYDPGDPDSYENYIKAMISDSVDYEGSILAGDRNTAQEYITDVAAAGSAMRRTRHDGRRESERDLRSDPRHGKEIANRSTYVSTDVRDAIS